MGLGSKRDSVSDPFAAQWQPRSRSGEQQTVRQDWRRWPSCNTPPQVKFKDLEEVVSHKINVNLMPFDVRTDFVKVTGDTVLIPVTLQVKNKDITFVKRTESSAAP